MTEDLECAYCGKPADWLCDYVLGWPFEMHEGREVIQHEALPYTCDLPMCAECTTKGDVTIMCRRGKGGGCERIEEDACHLHRHGGRYDLLIVKEEDVTGMRAEAYALARREGMKR